MKEIIVINRENIIILFASIFCYIYSIFGHFVFDDTEAILNNNDVLGESDYKQLFGNDFWGTNIRHNSSHKSYRPLTVVTFRIIRQFTIYYTNSYNNNGLNPKPFHIINVIIYAFVCLLLKSVLNKLLNIFCVKSDVKLNDLTINKRTAFLVSLLFTVHPIHSESVCACVGLADLLSCLVGLNSLLVYVKLNNCSNYVTNSFACISIIVLSGIAMLFKEQGITFIGLCIVLDLIHIIDRHNDDSSRKAIKLLIFRITLFCLGAIVLLFIRLLIMNFTGPEFQKFDNPASFEQSLGIRLINYSYNYSINIWITIYPLWLCFDWSMGCIPLIKDYYDYRITFAVIFWLVLTKLILIGITGNDASTKRHLRIGLAFAIIPFIPSSNLFFRVGFVIAERALFLPIVGYLVIMITGFNSLEKRLQNSTKIPFNVIHSSILLLIVILSIRTLRRCYDWNEEKSLFESGLNVCPLNAKIHYNIAKNAADRGDKDVAIEEYGESIRLNPEYDHALNNLANIMKESGQLIEAKELLLRALVIRPTFATAWMNLGIVQTALKDYSDAEESYSKAIKLRHRYADCLYNLGNLYVEQKRYNEAYNAWINSTIIKPKLLPAWNNLIVMLDNIGDYDRAQMLALEALKIHPNESTLHFNYANVLGKSGNFNSSEAYFQSAIKLNPNKASYYANLAVLYHRAKHYEKAMNNYLIAIRIDPDLKSAKDNMNSLKKVMNLRSQN